MARTKQTTRKSTGGKAPRKLLVCAESLHTERQKQQGTLGGTQGTEEPSNAKLSRVVKTTASMISAKQVLHTRSPQNVSTTPLRCEPAASCPTCSSILLQL